MSEGPLPAAALVAALSARGADLAVAESLTGGLLTSALVDVPGASRVLRGGVVAYATELKATLLGVDADLLAARGAVDADVAAQMAAGVRSRLGARIGVATTGVAGPDPQDGQEPGTVFVAVAAAWLPGGTRTRRHRFDGERPAVRTAAVHAALGLVAEVVAAGGAEQDTASGS